MAEQTIIEVIAPGCKVRLGTIDDQVDATILTVGIKQTGVQYECSWWDENVRKSDWVQASEIMDRGNFKKQKVGFRDEQE